jgi:glutathione S-transferase
MLPDAKLMLGAFAPDLHAPTRLIARLTFARMRARLKATFAIDEQSVAGAFEMLRAAGERFRAELRPSGYLIGEGFTVADLTLAALLSPLVAPPQFPYPQPQRNHPLLAPVRSALEASGVADWTREMYARHRGTSAEIRA